MQVTISVAGRFHAFYLAQQLLQRGYLKRLITSYPKFEVKKYGIPPQKVGSVIIKEIMNRGWGKLPCIVRKRYNPQYLIKEIYDKQAKRQLETCDIFVGWSSNCLHTLRQAKKQGAVAVLERGSSHMLYQQQILKQEYERFGLQFEGAHPKIIEKELVEYKEADYISVPSSFVKRTFLENGISEERLIQIPYGVDLFQFRQIPKVDKVFRVVFAGGMTLQKGVQYLLKAFSELNLPDSELMLLGGISDEIKPFFKKYKGNYRWLGHQSQRELYKYYSQGSVFVMPSVQEGFGMVQVQAMACGLPLICTINTGGPDLVDDGKEGFVISIRDVDSLKEKILFLYENPEKCYQMGQAAKRKVQQDFTWDDYGRKILQTYNDILP